jgi:hypothetical protein
MNMGIEGEDESDDDNQCDDNQNMNDQEENIDDEVDDNVNEEDPNIASNAEQVQEVQMKRVYDIDQFRVNITFPWEDIESSSDMEDHIFPDTFKKMFGFGSRISVHGPATTTKKLETKFSVMKLDNPHDVYEQAEKMKKSPFCKQEYMGNEYVIIRTPIEIAIPKEYVIAFIQSVNMHDNYNLELRQGWETSHVIIKPRSVRNNAPPLGVIIRAILREKIPYCSIVSNGLRMKFNVEVDRNGLQLNSDGNFKKEGKNNDTCVFVLSCIKSPDDICKYNELTKTMY